MGWLDDLSPESRAGWDEFVDHFRRDAAEKIAGSSAVVSLYTGKLDVKLAAELGTAILMDKPIVIVVPVGAEVPEKLRRVADRLVETDFDTEEGQHKIAAALGDLLEGGEQ